MNLYVGIDFGKFRHCVAAIDEQGQVVLKPFVVAQSQAELEALDQRLRALGEPAQTKIAVEATGHYWKLLWRFLLERGWQVEVLNPVLSAATARRHLRGRKTDADDALFIAKTLRDGGFHPLVASAGQLEQIKTLCRQRRWSVGVLSNAKRRLASLMDQTFPEFAVQFADHCGRAALAVLKEAPNSRHIAQLHLKRLTHLLCQGSNNQLGSSRAMKLRAAARHSLAVTHDDEALNCSVRLIVAQIEFLQEQLAQLGKQIARVFDALDQPIETIPGIGRVTAPVILAELGSVDRFVGPRGARRILADAGLDPCVRESGMWKGRTKMSKRGSPMLRTALFQAASMVRMYHPYFAAIYDRHRHERQKHHRIAISHVARKLVEIIYAVCKSKQPFDPAKLCPSSP